MNSVGQNYHYLNNSTTQMTASSSFASSFSSSSNTNTAESAATGCVQTPGTSGLQHHSPYLQHPQRYSSSYSQSYGFNYLYPYYYSQYTGYQATPYRSSPFSNSMNLSSTQQLLPSNSVSSYNNKKPITTNTGYFVSSNQPTFNPVYQQHLHQQYMKSNLNALLVSPLTLSTSGLTRLSQTSSVTSVATDFPQKLGYLQDRRSVLSQHQYLQKISQGLN